MKFDKLLFDPEIMSLVLDFDIRDDIISCGRGQNVFVNV